MKRKQMNSANESYAFEVEDNNLCQNVRTRNTCTRRVPLAIGCKVQYCAQMQLGMIGQYAELEETFISCNGGLLLWKNGSACAGLATDSSTESTATPPTAAFMSLCHPASTCNTTTTDLRCAAKYIAQKC